ncbi:MAG: hypothetical protein ABI051_00180 [Vicinamibacterales bacterium]
MRSVPSFPRGSLFLATVIALALLAVTPDARQTPAGTATPTPQQAQTSAVQALTALPALSNADFWRLTSELSEPDGTFHSENLVSNEARFQNIVPDLVKRVVPGRAYVGVGSEQNFTYIAATKPSHVFILDIRRGNTDLHLLYKALFETSVDRAEFVSRVFGRPRPAGLNTASTAEAIFAAFERAAPSQALHDRTYRDVITYLTTTRGFALSEGDRQGIAYVYDAWFGPGPAISYQLTASGGGGFGRGGGRGANATYAALMTSSDAAGKNWSYLATEDNYRFLKTLHSQNRIVPIVGNFGGPKALRAVATYLRQNRLVVSTFYTSNVQQYLVQDRIWDAFCASATTLPMDGSSTMIRSQRAGFAGAPQSAGGGFMLDLLPLRESVGQCATSIAPR